MTTFNRRNFLKAAAATGALSLTACASTPRKPIARVVVIGGGYGGATAAKYIRKWAPEIEVVLVERNPAFVSCPLSNLVLGGTRQIEDLTTGYDTLQSRYGVKLVRDTALAVDPDKRQVRLAAGDPISYDRLIVSPGVDFLYDLVPGLESAEAQARVLHAWKAGPQTVALRKQLEAIPDGGVYALHIPKAPYRCPPGPYERAAQVAFYFKQHKPRSKVLILDSNEDIVSKKGLFTKAWNDRYPGIVEYRPNSELIEVDAGSLTIKLINGDVKADVLNVVPPQRAGDIAKQAGLITANDRWCGVDWITTESLAVKGIHVLGDATLSAPGMPKSGFMANNHAKLAADAAIALLTGRAVNTHPIIANTCYSFVSDTDVVHVASVHKYDAEKKTLVAVQGAGGLSSAANELEGKYADSWARNIWSDALL
ncbi:twin-arginine translocation signal domain-containing protein [Pseudothauera nasutitermitis]|uniref:Twin-arginine translocation signal domain-containing protein n=1 Tax=Pseudothauera nasutitermitis TaxID=2565930 RepID=A0A4S4B3I3_9RHOO|nr:FCSD flavin-binding domain-containing protein [Pseudothauera nasutitermitis]THF67212.1 twin-arginine translocation signal domain-containing protein [Pseudothauera nasutitermitis]